MSDGGNKEPGDNEALLELVRARMAELSAAGGGEEGRSMNVEAAAARQAADVRRKAEAKHRAPAERLDHMQRELARAVSVQHALFSVLSFAHPRIDHPSPPGPPPPPPPKQITKGMRAEEQVAKTRSTAEAEAAAARNARVRLEELCRRLQQQNGALEARMRAQAAEEEARRTALLAQFRGSVAGIQEKIDAEQRERAALAADNECMRAELERLAGAAAAATAAASAAREHGVPRAALVAREKECAALRLRNRVLEMRVGEVEAAEAQQRAQLEEYTARMREFRDALAESNTLFENYAARLTEVCF